jgi:hypothetical protein
MALVVPEDWWRLPLTDEAALRRAVDTMVDRRFRGVDDQPLLRRDTAQALLDRAHRARAGGGVDMYLTADLVDGLPLALSLVVSLVPLPPGFVSLPALAREMEDDDTRPALVELSVGPAVRRQRIAAVDASELGAPRDQEMLQVDYTLLGPEDSLLLLTFSSPLVAVADALAELFEAVANTVRWTA